MIWTTFFFFQYILWAMPRYLYSVQKLLKLITKTMNPWTHGYVSCMWDESHIWLNDFVNKCYCSFGVKKAHMRCPEKTFTYTNISFGRGLWAKNCDCIAITPYGERRQRNMAVNFLLQNLDEFRHEWYVRSTK